MRGAALATPEVAGVSDIRSPWSGHELYIELSVSVTEVLGVVDGHRITAAVVRELLEAAPHAGRVMVHVDSESSPGETFHHHASRGARTTVRSPPGPFTLAGEKHCPGCFRPF